MPEITDPGLLAQLNGGAPAPAMPRQSNPQAPPPLRQVVAPQPRVSDAVAVENLRINQAQEARQVRKDREEQEEATRMRQISDEQAKAKMTTMVGRLSRLGVDANDNGGWFETGSTGALMRNIPGITNAAKDLEADTITVRGNLAFDTLQAMRDASKTGGALGQVSEIELQMLEAAMANINPSGQSHENFMRNIEDARQAYLQKLAMVDLEQARDMGYNPKRAKAVWERYASEYEKMTRGSSQASGGDDDIEALLNKYGS